LGVSPGIKPGSSDSVSLGEAKAVVRAPPWRARHRVHAAVSVHDARVAGRVVQHMTSRVRSAGDRAPWRRRRCPLFLLFNPLLLHLDNEALTPIFLSLDSLPFHRRCFRQTLRTIWNPAHHLTTVALGYCAAAEPRRAGAVATNPCPRTRRAGRARARRPRAAAFPDGAEQFHVRTHPVGQPPPCSVKPRACQLRRGVVPRGVVKLAENLPGLGFRV